jgi:hypothetical protein
VSTDERGEAAFESGKRCVGRSLDKVGKVAEAGGIPLRTNGGEARSRPRSRGASRFLGVSVRVRVSNPALRGVARERRDYLTGAARGGGRSCRGRCHGFTCGTMPDFQAALRGPLFRRTAHAPDASHPSLGFFYFYARVRARALIIMPAVIIIEASRAEPRRDSDYLMGRGARGGPHEPVEWSSLLTRTTNPTQPSNQPNPTIQPTQPSNQPNPTIQPTALTYHLTHPPSARRRSPTHSHCRLSSPVPLPLLLCSLTRSHLADCTLSRFENPSFFLLFSSFHSLVTFSHSSECLVN